MSTLREEIEVDIAAWYANHELCPTCLINLRALPSQANIVPHYYGLCLDEKYNEVEAEEERQKEALRKFYERERKPLTIPFNRARLWQVGIACFVGAVLIYWHFLAPLMWKIFR